MDKIKKIGKEISVFGLVLVVFLGLFVYRNITYKTYTTISTSKLEAKIKAKDCFVFVAGNTGDSDTTSYQSVVEMYCTKHKGQKVYYVDLSKADDNFIPGLLKVEAQKPSTFYIKDGALASYRQGTLSYYQLYDFIRENA